MNCRKNRLSVVIGTFLFSLLLHLQVDAQQSFAKLKFSWKKPIKWPELPEQYKNNDAVTISQDIYLSNIYDPAQKYPLYSTMSIKQRIRILTKSALDELSNFELDEFRGGRPITIDARTIKPSGETLIANRESIKELKEFDKSTGHYTYKYRIAIPGAEVGDDIEIVYAMEKDYLTYSKDIYMHGQYPILKSTFTLYTTHGVVTNIYNHNGMSEPKRNEQTDQTIDTWVMENLTALKDQPYHISDNELPFIRIHVDKISLPFLSRPIEIGMKSWNEMYDGITSDVFARDKKDKGLSDFFAGFKSTTDTMGTLSKVKFMVEYLNKNVEFVDKLSDDDKSEPLAELIHRKKIDGDNLILFYKYMFKEFNIPAFVGLAKNKFSGELAFDERTGYQISDVIFAFSEENSMRHFLYPSDENALYHVDERPFYLEDTKLVLLKKDDPNDNQPAVVSFGNIPHLSTGINSRSIKFHYKVTADGDATVEAKGTYEGMISTYLRHNWQNILKKYNKHDLYEWLEEKDSTTFVLDTVMQEECETNSPYTYKYTLTNKVKDVVSEAGDGIHSVKLHLTPGHFNFGFNEKERTTTAFYPFAYTDEISAFIEFPAAVTILNEADFNKRVDNEIGFYEESLVKMSPTVYKLTSKLKIKTPVVPKEKYQQWIEVNKLVKDQNDRTLLYK